MTASEEDSLRQEDPGPSVHTGKNNNGFVSIQSSPVAGRRILFINAGSRKKRITFEEALRLGLSITLVHPGKRCYADPYCDTRIDSTGKSLEEVFAEIKKLHKAHPFDGVITFLEEDVEFTAEIAKRLGLIGIDPTVALVARNKFLMRKKLMRAKVPVPHAKLVSTINEALLATKELGYPLVLKPFKGTDSMWVFKVQSESELHKAFSDITKYSKHPYEAVVPVETKKYVLEQYMSGPEVSVEALAQNGKVVVVGIIDKLPMSEPFFIERGDVCPSRHPEEVQTAIKKVAEATVHAIGIKNGIAHVEIKVTPEGPKVVEIAARMGGDYICDWMDTVYNVNLARQGILIALGSPMDEFPTRPKMHLRADYFIPEEDSILKNVVGIREIEYAPNVHNVYIWAHKGDTLLTPPRGFDTAGWLIVSGKSAKEVDEHMQHIRSLVAVEFEPLAKHKGERQDIVQLPIRKNIATPEEPEVVNISDEQDSKEARSLWERFVDTGNPLLDWEFREAFARGYGDQYRFIRADGVNNGCVGLLPLQYVEDRKRWEFFGTYWFEDTIFCAKNEQIVRQLIAKAPRPLFLNGISHLELRRFQSLPLDFEEEKFTLDLTQYASAEEIFDDISSHRKCVIRRKLKKFEALHPTTEKQEWPEAVEHMIFLNKKRFGEVHTLTPARSKALIEVYKKDFSHLKKRVITLKVGEQIAAIGFALCNTDRYICLNAGWNVQQFPYCEAALTMAHIQDAIQMGCSVFDALSGDYGWKNYWGLNPKPLYFLAIGEMDESGS